ncbi:glutamyl-tRNA synthetase [Cantharellus anzutake]|uniref:glutamyl-tRNA synthetase n=1 Tax=Cantharellus anzutake TaxID=1750568 RepID=UPI0019078C49|nr:glutamyl-tRNA synthetase [Cantharellus anzutake]KAF8329115.1 glutamyl-tRNA synthetase [Cantharellus anzutake]
MASAKILLRFAPSPTGPLHLGGLRTALINHLVARKLRGKWILRVEDTDQSRLVPGSVNNIISCLGWAGLEYDYGPYRDGLYGPYFQSKRLDLYHFHARALLEAGHAYRCFCGPEKLAEIRGKLAKLGSKATYDRTCLHLPEEESIRRVKAGEKYVIRLKDASVFPESPDPNDLNDLVFGSHRQSATSRATDTILIKTDRFPTYHFASVVDDHNMEITHVIRGEEWLSSLPLHLELYSALSQKPPQYAHVPLLLNKDGSKMSKRKGDTQVFDFIEQGWQPEAVLNWLALAGWSRSHDDESQVQERKVSVGTTSTAPDDVLALDELIQKFDLASLTHRKNILDPTKLAYLNRHHLQIQLSRPQTRIAIVRKATRIGENSARTPINSRISDFITTEYVAKALPSLMERLANLKDLPTVAPYLFTEPNFSSSDAKVMSKSFSEDTLATIKSSASLALAAVPCHEWNAGTIQGAISSLKQNADFAETTWMKVLRYALTASKIGPSILDIMCILGRQRTLTRLC